MVGRSLWIYRGNIHCIICYGWPHLRFLPRSAHQRSKGITSHNGLCYFYAHLFALNPHASNGINSKLACYRFGYLPNARNLSWDLAWNPCALQVKQCCNEDSLWLHPGFLRNYAVDSPTLKRKSEEDLRFFDD